MMRSSVMAVMLALVAIAGAPLTWAQGEQAPTEQSKAYTDAGRYATRKMVAGVIRLIGEMADDAEHPLRLQFDEFVVNFIRRLKEEPELRAKVEAIKHDLLAQPALAAYLQGLWSELVGWMQADLTREDSVLRHRAAAAIRTRAARQRIP